MNSSSFSDPVGHNYLTYWNYTAFCLPTGLLLAVFIVLQLQFMFMGLFRTEPTKVKCGFLTMEKAARKMDRNKYKKYLARPKMDQFIVIFCSIFIFISDVASVLLRKQYTEYFGVNM